MNYYMAFLTPKIYSVPPYRKTFPNIIQCKNYAIRKSKPQAGETKGFSDEHITK